MLRKYIPECACYDEATTIHGATNAKKPPTEKIATESPYTRTATMRVRAHAAASAGSIGHGRLRARHCRKPAMASIAPAPRNIPSLCSDSQINCGTAENTEDKAAPAPTVTSSAGNAQQTKVLPLVRSDSIEASLL